MGIRTLFNNRILGWRFVTLVVTVVFVLLLLLLVVVVTTLTLNALVLQPVGPLHFPLSLLILVKPVQQYKNTFQPFHSNPVLTVCTTQRTDMCCVILTANNNCYSVAIIWRLFSIYCPEKHAVQVPSFLSSVTSRLLRSQYCVCVCERDRKTVCPFTPHPQPDPPSVSTSQDGFTRT